MRMKCVMVVKLQEVNGILKKVLQTIDMGQVMK